MDGMESKIQRILSDPEAMGAVLNMAKSLGVSGASSAPSEDEIPKEQSEPAADDGGGLGGFSELLGNIDPALMGKLMGLLGEYTRSDDRRISFLKALKPYLREERAEQIDRASQMVRIARTASKALESWNGE